MRNKDATSFGGSQVLAQTNASGSSTAPAQSAVQSDSAAVGNDVEVADSEAVPDGMSDPEVVDTTTEDFLTAVLPAPNGERCFYYGSGKDKPSDTKTPARSHRDLMSVGQTTNNDRRSPKQFWFATAAHSYLNAMRPIAKGGSKSTKDGGRAAHNVEARKCFSIDIDLDASGYKKSKPCHKTVGEALIALREDCKAGGFPQPAFIVSSGYGLHCYWAFDGDVPLDRWREAATKFKRFMKRCEKRAADTSRWSDPNGYLRLPGTHNKKNMNEPRLVKIIGGTGANHSFDKLEAVLAKVAGDGAKEQVDKLISSFTSKAAATADPEIGSGYPSYFSVMRALPLVSADDRDIWLRFAAFMKSWGRVHSQPLAAFEMFVAWARTSGEFDKVGKDGLSGDAACRKLWGSVADGEHAGKVTFGTIRRFANEASAKKDHAYADECLARASIMAEKLNGIESIKEATKAAVDSLTFDKFLEESPPVIPHDQVWLMWRLWNRENCVVKRGGKTVYMQQLRETRELKIGGTAMPYEHITDSYSRKSDLCEYRGVVNYEREEVRADGTKVIDEETGRPKIVTRNLVNTWLKSTDRRAYQHVGFYPGTKVPERHANLWTGFRTEPRAGDWSKLRNHIKDNICQGDEQSFAWLMTWMAHMFQRPWEKPGTCVALRGGKGVGKSKLSQWLRFVIGQASFTASSSEHVTGRL